MKRFVALLLFLALSMVYTPCGAQTPAKGVMGRKVLTDLGFTPKVESGIRQKFRDAPLGVIALQDNTFLYYGTFASVNFNNDAGHTLYIGPKDLQLEGYTGEIASYSSQSVSDGISNFFMASLDAEGDVKWTLHSTEGDINQNDVHVAYSPSGDIFISMAVQPIHRKVEVTKVIVGGRAKEVVSREAGDIKLLTLKNSRGKEITIEEPSLFNAAGEYQYGKSFFYLFKMDRDGNIARIGSLAQEEAETGYASPMVNLYIKGIIVKEGVVQLLAKLRDGYMYEGPEGKKTERYLDEVKLRIGNGTQWQTLAAHGQSWFAADFSASGEGCSRIVTFTRDDGATVVDPAKIGKDKTLPAIEFNFIGNASQVGDAESYYLEFSVPASTYSGTIDVFGRKLQCKKITASYLARTSMSGEVQWITELPATCNVSAVYERGGKLIAGGSYTNEITLGKSKLTPHKESDVESVGFVAFMDPATGAFLEGHSLKAPFCEVTGLQITDEYIVAGMWCGDIAYYGFYDILDEGNFYYDDNAVGKLPEMTNLGSFMAVLSPDAESLLNVTSIVTTDDGEILAPKAPVCSVDGCAIAFYTQGTKTPTELLGQRNPSINKKNHYGGYYGVFLHIELPKVKKKQFKVTFTAGVKVTTSEGRELKTSGETVEENADLYFTVTAPTSQRIKKLTVAGAEVEKAAGTASYSGEVKVTKDIAISAEYEAKPKQFKVTFTAGVKVRTSEGRELKTSGETVEENTDLYFTVTAPAGQRIKKLTVAGAEVKEAKGLAEYNGFRKGVTTDFAVEAMFEDMPPRFEVTYGEGVSVKLEDGTAIHKNDKIEKDSKLRYAIAAPIGQVIATLTVAGTEVAEAAGKASYSGEVRVTNDVHIKATYAKPCKLNLTIKGSGTVTIARRSSPAGGDSYTGSTEGIILIAGVEYVMTTAPATAKVTFGQNKGFTSGDAFKLSEDVVVEVTFEDKKKEGRYKYQAPVLVGKGNVEAIRVATGIRLAEGDGLDRGEKVRLVIEPDKGYAEQESKRQLDGLKAADGGLYEVTGNVKVSVTFVEVPATAAESLLMAQTTIGPSPAVEQLFVHSAANVLYWQLFALCGQRVAGGVNAGEAEFTISVSDLAEGVYVLRFVARSGEQRSFKVVKSRK